MAIIMEHFPYYINENKMPTYTYWQIYRRNGKRNILMGSIYDLGLALRMYEVVVKDKVVIESN